MKSEAHGRLYVIISGSLKPDREWLSWMVIVTLPPWETRRALGLLHRDIQSYSLLHIMELSSQRANGSDPFNLCQKHTDEEVPNARPLPWGRHSPPPPLLPLAAPFLLLDSLTGAPHLSSFTAQSGETGRLASRRPLHMPRPAHKDTGCPTKQLQLLEEPARPRREGVVGGDQTPTAIPGQYRGPRGCWRYSLHS